MALFPADPDKRTDEIGNTNKQRQFTPADFNRLTINRMEASLSLQRGSGGSVCGGESDAAHQLVMPVKSCIHTK
jgi:hypothetical protein